MALPTPYNYVEEREHVNHYEFIMPHVKNLNKALRIVNYDDNDRCLWMFKKHATAFEEDWTYWRQAYTDLIASPCKHMRVSGMTEA